MPPTTTELHLRPIRLRGRDVNTVQGLADCIIDESDEHVRRTPLADTDQRDDFQLSCDALNLWRMFRRLEDERLSVDLGHLREQIAELICQRREYAPDEFDFALAATKQRPRSAFGLGPLEQAHLRSRRADFRLLVPELKESELATDIAAIAWHLQTQVGNAHILLPIEQLRSILAKRKIVISGAVRRLVDCGLLRMVNENYHTRRAREYLFSGEQGTHFEIGRTNEDEG